MTLPRQNQPNWVIQRFNRCDVLVSCDGIDNQRDPFSSINVLEDIHEDVFKVFYRPDIDCGAVV